MPARKLPDGRSLKPATRPDSTAAAKSPSKPAGATPQRSIQSIEVGFTLINALERAERPLSLKEVAQGAGMSASKAHFYMVSFKRVGLVTQYEDTGHYALGRYALDLGLSALRRLDLVEISREAMRKLSSEINESVFLSVWGNQGPTIVFKVDGPRRIPMTLQIGYVLPLLKSATGRIFLSYLPRQQTENRLRDEVAALAPAVRETLDAEKLKARIRKHGLAETDSLLNDGFAGISAPIWNHQGELAGAVTIISPSDRPADRSVDQKEALQGTAQELSRALGAPAPRDTRV
jgi:DNA-binding IclR family transcriptional regulator